MDQIPLHGVVQIVAVHHLAIQQAALTPPHLSAPLLVDEQPAAQLLGLDFQEPSEFLQVHGRVEFEVGLDGRGPHCCFDFVEEDGEVVVDRVDVQFWVVEVRRCRGDEFRAGGAEEVFEQREGFGPAALQAGELIAVFFAQGGVDGVVEFGGVEGDADGDEGVHLVIFLGDAVVLGRLLKVFGAADVDEDVGEHADGVGVAAHHHVAEANVVVGCEVGGHDAGEHCFFVEFNVVEGFEGEAEVAEEAVHTQEADDAEVAQHAVKGPRAVFAGDGHGVLVAFHGSELLVDLRALD